MGVKTIKTFAERMRSEGVTRAIMVTIASITPFARQCLQEMAQKYYIETVALHAPHNVSEKNNAKRILKWMPGAEPDWNTV